MTAILKKGLVTMIKQGVTRRRISVGIALAMTISVFPIFFLPAMICLVTALLLRLNQPIMQIINYVAGPIQVLLFLPFMRLGEKAFGLDRYPLTLEQLRSILELSFGEIILQLCLPIGRAMAGWMVVAPGIFVIGYVVLHSLTGRLPSTSAPMQYEPIGDA
jgi:hypothetical protein